MSAEAFGPGMTAADAVRERFEFLCRRDGVESAIAFIRQNVIATYRRVVLIGKTHTLYRRRLIESYCAAKRILAESEGHP